jgi:hypothetical protein
MKLFIAPNFHLHNKLECLLHARVSQPSLMFGRKILPLTNTPVYHKNSQITAVRSFITLAREVLLMVKA